MVSHRCLFVTSSRFNHRGGSESHWMCVCFTALVRFFQVLPLQNVTRIHERLRFPNEIVYRFVPGCPGFKRSTRDKCYFDVHHPPHYRHGFPRASLGLQPTVEASFEANPWDNIFWWSLRLPCFIFSGPYASFPLHFPQGRLFTSRVSISERSHFGRASSSLARLFFIFRKEFPVRNV